MTFNYRKGFSSLPVAITLSILLVGIAIVIGMKPKAVQAPQATATISSQVSVEPTEPPVKHTPSSIKYQLLAEFAPVFFCDPDLYPVARNDEQQKAIMAFADIQSDAEEFGAILEHFGYSDVHSFTSEQKLAIYRDHKKFSAIQLTPQYSEFGTPTPTSYRFSLRTGEKSSGYLVEGTIGFSTIKVERKTQSVNMCPI